MTPGLAFQKKKQEEYEQYLRDQINANVAHYGYPLCCVEEFYSSRGIHTKEFEEVYFKGVFYGTGFIPCPTCLKKDPAELIKEINEHRNKSLPPFHLA